MKKISVIVPNYNSGKHIKKCIEALLEQEYPIAEIIIIDDCSTDKSNEIIQEFVNKHNNIMYIKNPTNRGVSFSRNQGINVSNSEYLMFCDADDWYEKNATKKLIECLEKYKADFVCAGYYITYSDNKKIEIKYPDLFEKEVITKEECIAYLPITSSAKLIKRSILIENKINYPEGIKNCEELPVIPVVAFKSQKAVYLDECIYNYYQRENSASNKIINDLSFYDETYEKFKNNIPKEFKEAINIRMAEHLLYSKTFSLIKNNFKKEEIIKNIKKCKKNLEGQKIKKILEKFPIRKKLFLICALLEISFPLKIYVALQQKLLKE